MADLSMDVRDDGIATAPDPVRRGFAHSPVKAGDVCGVLYTPDRVDAHRPGLLVLGGSDGGAPRAIAQQFAMLGYPVFAQVYVDPHRSGAPFRRIPVERLTSGLELLAGTTCVDPRRLSVIGVSKGGEAALLLASRVPELSAVIGITASGIMFQSPGRHRGGSWSEAGRELPYARFPSMRLAAALLRHRDGERGVRFDGVYRAAAERAGDEVVIPLEHSRAHLLLFSGEQDALWPASMLAQRAVNRARASDHDRLVEHVRYPDAGHDLAPPADRDTVTITAAGSGVALALGGDPAASRVARIDAWKRMCAFLERTVGR
jgi:dienelactone hydrolase